MRIVTLNTWKNEGDYPRRLDLMARGLTDLAPGVVCLQECFVGAGQDTAAALARALGHHLYARPASAKPRLHDGRSVGSTSGLAILSRRPAQSEAALTLETDPADGERIAQRLGLDDLRLLNLHLTHLRGSTFDLLRARQLAAALDWAGQDRALLVAGDLNATADDGALAALKAEVGFDVPTLQGPRADSPPIRGRAIDHLVLHLPGGWRVAQRFRALDVADAQGWFPSDHAAVVVDLERG